MKKSELLAASVAAASATAISASSSSPSFSRNPNFEASTEVKKGEENSGVKRSASRDKFAPRFDGLRFIETLITAHR
ncbi:hypothetical protein SLE2022_050110 [Rubroshorea leprosula]|uniref:Uncharacterized protein n=1 Tax=Rubroshorea leprosula TaxID=152421 RepID=A0AAV5IEZ4_9ROSI|nr:hypothetical protein SLEP1_g9696 [Rubroshorea leprosula]